MEKMTQGKRKKGAKDALLCNLRFTVKKELRLAMIPGYDSRSAVNVTVRLRTQSSE